MRPGSRKEFAAKSCCAAAALPVYYNDALTDEWVVVVVWGPKGQADIPKTMVVRAKKSDIDSYSRGSLGSDEFQRSVRILTFPEGK